MGQAAEHVFVVLKQVGIDRANFQPVAGGKLAERIPIVDAVPRNMDRDRRADPGEAVHHPGVGELFLDRARRTRLREDLEPGP